jgi:glutamate N-acetyltransferase/amino-acid N-acetyltransferase
MAVNLEAASDLLPVAGVRIGCAEAEIKYSCRLDLVLFEFCEGTDSGGVYTQSHFAAAPVVLAKARQTQSRSWLVNSGNANAATGEQGELDAANVCSQAARLLQISDQQVQPFSTGVIGERLPVERMNAGLLDCYQGLNEDGWLDAARGIMTTDTVPKGGSRVFDLGGCQVTLTGIAKGSGMIKPNMATMLAYLACDARVDPGVARFLVEDAVNASFNRITVDGDTSTNDCFMLACTGQVENDRITGREHPLYTPLLEEVRVLARELAQALVRDGEGATKFVTVRVVGGKTPADCLAVAYTIAESPLVKTALFAGDANWGRFCMAIGRAPIQSLDPNRVALWLDEVQVADCGMMCDDYKDAQGAAVLSKDEFEVRVDLGIGRAEEVIWTTDLSYDYIKINAEYRT